MYLETTNLGFANPCIPKARGRAFTHIGIGAGSRQQVHVIEEDGTLRAIEVVTGQSDGRRTVVRSADLKPGMEVVTGVRALGE